MLRLKRLELQGFKSFADRTELRFDGAGIIAIVGPNGCGKSNLADAINWVLGEQSAKTLRGARMEDVIFAGTRERKPVSLAQVTIVLAEPSVVSDPSPAKPNGHPVNGKSASRPREITITRRLFRSGESEYLMDGRPARLRDIQDFFMGLGLGPDSYAIIEQGRIGQILSSKPQDRRLLLEEAAGISRYKARRRLAEARLEGAKHNLERVFDILEEVGRQVNSLKRQAAKARRYEELKAQMDAQLRLVLAARHRLLEREAAKIALELNLAASAAQSLTAQVAEKDRDHGTLQAVVFETETRLTEARSRLAELNLALERTRGRLESQTRQIAGIQEGQTRGAAQLREIEERLGRLKEEVARHESNLAALKQEAAQARTHLEAKSRERERLDGAVSEGERAIESSRVAILRLLGEASQLRNQLAQMEEHLAAIQRDQARAAREEEAASSDLKWLEQTRAELSQKAAACQLELERLTEQRRRLEEALATARREAAATREERDRLRTEFSELKARRNWLDEILSHRAYTTEAVKRLFTAIERGQEREFRPLGVLADFVEVEPAWESAVEEFLHEELEYVVVESWSQAQRGLELLRAGGEGRATFLVLPAEEQAACLDAEAPADPEMQGPLTSVLRVGHGLSKYLPRLKRCRLVRNPEAARRLAAAHPDLYFLLPDGVCYHGCALSGGKKTVGGPLALKRELRELKTKVELRQQQMEAAAARLTQLEQEIACLEAELERLRALEQRYDKEAVGLEHERKKLAEEINRASSRLSLAGSEQKRLIAERDAVVQERQRRLQTLAEIENRRQELEHSTAQAREQLEQLRAAAARCAEEHSALRVELAGVQERERSEAATLTRLENQLRELEDRRRELAAELERLNQERTRLTAENEEFQERLASLTAEVAAAQRQVQELEGVEIERRQQLSRLEEALRQLRTEAQAAQDRRAQVELELVKRQAELRFLDETSRKELNTPVADLSQGDEITPDEETLAAAEQKYQELKAKIEALGPVNPQALEEYQETQQRYDFLNTQRQDLLDSIRDTEQAIREIDAETRKRFQEAFTAINAHFNEMFRALFGGGSAEMRLTDPENLAESGIDIIASPPGKRLQNVLLLSGGEKALAALALLLAIFKFQPSPFCVLDEVDAPLDDPNIDRLIRLLKEMSTHTQFILITHTKRTMEAAQALYGVTMQEPGVSKLVSVRFQTPPPPQSTETMVMAARA